MTSVVNKIINFSNVDGPGNRTSIFFQQCNYNCRYCHNPETINKCLNCGACITTCPVNAISMTDGLISWDDKKCVNCDTCLKTCKNNSSPKTKVMSTDEVLDKIKINKPYIKGITVSGGECTLNADFLKELFPKVKEMGLTCFIDSNGSYDFERDQELMACTDAVMLDVKAYSKEFHQFLCSYDNELVLKNLNYLLDNNKMYEVRTVLVPGFEKDNLETVRKTAAIIKDRCRYKLIRYRPYGVRDSQKEVLSEFELTLEEAQKYVDAAILEGCTTAFVL